jgi:hypothetical protein
VERRSVRLLTGFLLVCVTAFSAGAFGQAQPAAQTFQGINGKPVFVVIPRGNADDAMLQAFAAVNVPLWSSTFKVGTTTFKFTMVGTNPALGSATTSVPVVIIPVRFKFSNGNVLSPVTNACGDTQTPIARTMNSPIFKNMTFKPGGTNVGTTQYIDAFQRANFWQTVSVSAPNYHVLLGPVTVKAVQTITVPAASGTTVAGPCAKIGEVNINFFDAKAQALITSLAVPATSLALFVDYNTFLTQNGCCILGYHSANGANHTYAVAAYSDPKIFNVPIQDIHALSHEIGEWMDDPFGNNLTPPWGNVGQVSGCQNNLEDGDPVTGKAFTATLNGFTYHPEDLVFLSWFAHQKPSTAVNGQYTFLKTFTIVAAKCPPGGP